MRYYTTECHKVKKQYFKVHKFALRSTFLPECNKKHRSYCFRQVTECISGMSALGGAEIFKTGSDELWVARHANQLTLHRHQFQAKLFQIQLDQLCSFSGHKHCTKVHALASWWKSMLLSIWLLKIVGKFSSCLNIVARKCKISILEKLKGQNQNFDLQ